MTNLKLVSIAKGIGTYVPGLGRLACRGFGGAASARYCYSVWLRHLVKAGEAGLLVSFHRVAELGPGDTLGVGLAAMLSGVDQYFALDAKRYANARRDLDVFEELVRLFSQRTPIPDGDEFPYLYPALEHYEFPHEFLPKETLQVSLRPDRIGAIRQALQRSCTGIDGIRVTYVAPWDEFSLDEVGTVDMVFSQAVLEHVEDVRRTYRALARFLRDGGLMSHTIDFKSHDVTHDWNGHWTVSDFAWKIVQGRRPYFINRLPLSVHIAALEDAGFQITGSVKRIGIALERARLAPRFTDMSADDLRTCGCFIQAVKGIQ